MYNIFTKFSLFSTSLLMFKEAFPLLYKEGYWFSYFKLGTEKQHLKFSGSFQCWNFEAILLSGEGEEEEKARGFDFEFSSNHKASSISLGCKCRDEELQAQVNEEEVPT